MAKGIFSLLRVSLDRRAKSHLSLLTLVGVMSGGLTTVHAATMVAPGTTVVLTSADDRTCDDPVQEGPMSGGVSVTATCRLEESTPRHLDLQTFSGFSTVNLPSGQRAIAAARLSNQISIPEKPTAGGVEVLQVQIATQVSWSGVLFAAGFNSTFAQATGTLQVRDTTTDLVVASNRFLSERLDADLSLNAVDAVDGVDVTNSASVDVTALLLRGRTYAIEVTGRCDISVPVIGAAACSFFDAQTSIPGVGDLFGGDGFSIQSITVTVANDVVSRLAGN